MSSYRHFEKLDRLWKAEAELVSWAKIIISNHDHLLDHIELAETYMSTVEDMRPAIPKGDDSFALGGLFLRTFDQTGHALRAAVTGNYTGCVMFSRDLLETNFLLDYLMDDEIRAVQWLKADRKTLKKSFKPVEIRKYLDERDGFIEKKRAAHYERLSTLGTHPSALAFELKRDGGRVLHSGPLKHRELLDECVQEIALVILLLSVQLLNFLECIENGARVGSRLSLLLQRTRETYFEKSRY